MSSKYKSFWCLLHDYRKIDDKLFYKFKIPARICHVLSNKSLPYHTFSSQTPDSNSNRIQSHEDSSGNNSANAHHKILKSLSRYFIICFSIGLITTVSYSIIKSFQKKSREFDENFSDNTLWQPYVKEIKKFISFIQNPSSEKLLPDISGNHQQPFYTLVLELPHVLVYPDWTYRTGWRFKKRPGLDFLLENLAGMFEIVIYTTSHSAVMYSLVEALDTRKLVSYKLGRDATQFVDGHHVKNLENLNRNLSRVIVIDWHDESVKFHTDNLLKIGKWQGNDDKVLIDLTSFLATIAENEIEDVREVLKYYKTFDDPLSAFREKQKILFGNVTNLVM